MIPSRKWINISQRKKKKKISYFQTEQKINVASLKAVKKRIRKTLN